MDVTPYFCLRVTVETEVSQAHWQVGFRASIWKSSAQYLQTSVQQGGVNGVDFRFTNDFIWKTNPAQCFSSAAPNVLYPSQTGTKVERALFQHLIMCARGNFVGT